MIYSCLLLFTIGIIFTVYCYYPLMNLLIINEEKGNLLLEFLKNDEYYCFLFPLMLPLSVLILYVIGYA